jgi:hypothetical protein
MANRTIQIWGQGYGPTDCTANATFNGNQVYNGTIPTLNTTDIDRSPSGQTSLFSFEVPLDLSGQFPMEITFTGSVVYVAQVYENYIPAYNPIYNASQLEILTNIASTREQKLTVYEQVATPPLTTDQINTILTGTYAEVDALITSLGIKGRISSGETGFGSVTMQNKTNVVIDGIPQSIPNPPPMANPGEWGWEIEPAPGSTGTMSFTLNITPAVI